MRMKQPEKQVEKYRFFLDLQAQIDILLALI